jgi:CelD/BcsL family acetyltransferase involved in cellulose biosynthesis
MTAAGTDLEVAGQPDAPDRRAPEAAGDENAPDGASDAWRTLAGRAAEDNVFFDPDFVRPFLREMGRSAQTATIHTRGRLAAVVPVVRTQLGRIAPAHRFLSHEYGPLGVPLVDRRNIAHTAASLLEGLTNDHHCLIAQDLPLEGPVAAALAAAASSAGKPVVLLDRHERATLVRSNAGATDPMAGLSARRRGEYQRLLRRLGEYGPVAFEAAREAPAVAQAFDEFLVLEEASWKGRAGTALLSKPETKKFAQAMIAALASRGKVRVDTVRVGGAPAAILVTLIAGRSAFTWKVAHDERFARFSPGAQIMLEAGKTIMAEPGIERIDSLATADHPMIDRLWRDRLAIGTLVIGPAGGSAVFNLGVAAARAEIAARTAARNIRRRFG